MKKVNRISLLLLLTLGSAFSVFAQNNFFTDAGENKLMQTTGQRMIVPQKFRASSADTRGLKDFLWSLPAESAILNNHNAAPVLELPMPDGSMAKFHVWESSIMEPGLAARFPEMRSFAGQGIDDPYATIRFDYNPYFGFHAQVLSALKGRVFIDPYARYDVSHYMSYYTGDNHNLHDFVCETVADQQRTELVAAGPCRGTQLYTYRLALACTGEYAVAVAGASPTTVAVAAAMLTSVNRVTGVYEKELAIRLVLVANNNLLIYLNSATDPYTNSNGSTMLGQNQTNIDNVIGTANYDIGHVFSTGGGGIAGLGVVCRAGQKANGVTGSSSPVGDNYDIDYVAHEMGHQFGADHTFNSTTGSCGGGNRNAATAYEPGSATTIMGYAGICGTDDIQPHSDPFFHSVSFDEISTYVAGTGGTCPVMTSTGNTLPAITAMNNSGVSIPVNTPFTLTGSATDANGDALTYCWEEWDLGTSGAWNNGASSTTAPLFKSRIPLTTGSRTFPDLAVILAGYPASPTATMGGLKGETLPGVARTMKFRLTVRDNRAGGGGVVTGGSGCQAGFTTTFQVNVVGSTAFSVTAPNGGENYSSGSVQTVTWNNAGTTAAPFSVANVKISLSTDGGLTYPTVLAASTPNDGTEALTLPNISTATARIKIEAIGNIFFDISNANFTIAAGGCTINCPANITVSNTLNQCGAVVTYAAPTTNGGCGTVTASPASGSFFPVGTTTVTVTSTAGPSCSFTVTVQDTQAPAITCPSNIIVSNALNQCGAVVNFGLPAATDNCPGSPTVTASPASGSFFPVGTTTVTVTASDASINSPDATCTFTVTVQDTQAPAITCPSNIIVSNALNQCGAVVNFGLPAASDNCPGSPTVTASPASGSFFPVGTTTVTVTASDASINSPDATCTFTVTVQDTQAPSITCPSNVVVTNELNQCGATVNFTLPSATDNCPGVPTVTASPSSGSFFPVGTTTVTVTASDASVNSPDATCTFTVTVQDTQAPFITCPSNIIVSNAFNQCGAVVNFTLPSATDNCPGTPTVTASPSSGSFFPVGTTTVTVTASDASINSPDATCTFTVTVLDTQAPFINCPSTITVASDPNQCGAVVNFSLPVAPDNCPGATTVSSSPAPGSFFPVGTTTVTVTAADNSPDSPDATCSFNIVVTTTVAGTVSGTATVVQNGATSSPITFTGSGGVANYTFMYTLNGGPVQSLSTTGGNNTVTLLQSNAAAGSFTYTLLSVTDANGCSGTITGLPSAIITVVNNNAPDLTNSQFFTTTQIGAGGTIDEVIGIRNVGTTATSAPIVFTVTNYAGITGLSAASLIAPTVTIGFTTYTLTNANWTVTSNASALTFTSDAGFFINPGTTAFVGVRITRAAGANGTVTHSATVTAGTGGGETPSNNNSISNIFLKN